MTDNIDPQNMERTRRGVKAQALLRRIADLKAELGDLLGVQSSKNLLISREDFDRAQEVGQIGSWRLDVQKNILAWSNEAYRIFGLPIGTPLTYETFLSTIHPDDRDYVDTQWKAGMSGAPYDIEHRIVAGDEVKWVREKAYLEFDEKGALLGGFGITQDITDRKRAEEELRESEARFRGMFMNNRAVMLLIDPESGRIENANAAASKYYGYSHRRLSEMSIWDLNVLPPDQVRAEMALAKSEERLNFQFQHRLASGEIRDVEVFSGPLPVAGETKLYSIIFDITERKRAEQERERLLAEVERRVAELDSIMYSVADSLLVYNTAGEIVHMNPASERMFGYTAEDRGKSLTDRVKFYQLENSDGKPIALEDTPTYRAIQGKTTSGKVMGLHFADKTLWVSSSAAPVVTPDGELLGAVATFTDITALHDLQEQQRVFMHLVSHDLRAPITIIKGYAGILADALRERRIDGDLAAGTEAILRGVQRMNIMIDDLVDSARVEGGGLRMERHPVDLAAYLPEFLRRSATLLKVERVMLDIPPDLPPAYADYNRLERIMTNLLTNALNYSAPDTPVKVSVRSEGEEVIISITDQGAGISPENMPHLFQRFFRAKSTQRKAQGLGLGLYITKLMVEAHGMPAEAGAGKVGGRIWVTSEEGKGSTFSFSLPVYKE